ncbi:hypothetical protein CASFOL_031150 [Castilleja foliolosa]|uniref:Uncharacterized protein n=1 Tax=Castilleja foliolosa TaxID=1961234 RepID=A0ABD3C6T0_9LAMI
MCLDPEFGPLEENEATTGAGILTPSDLCTTADGVLHNEKNPNINDSRWNYIEKRRVEICIGLNDSADASKSFDDRIGSSAIFTVNNLPFHLLRIH